MTSTLALEGGGRVGEYVGGYSDWLRQRPPSARDVAGVRPAGASREPASAARATAPESGDRRNDGHKTRQKLSYKDSRELEQLPARIETLEAEIARRTQAMHAPDFFRQEAATIVAANQALAGLQAELDAAYSRWQELEG